ncbi:MAG: alanine racemase [Bacteroidales bacterium]|jgi:alanine racemase|nr:alanine racemase [Bacteroidales bacterium]MDN5350451.1 alanine racemase [Bacteroidales bacterium]
MTATSFHTPSIIELSYDAIAHNLSFIKRFVKKNVRISSVVKGNAYGHGIEIYVPAAEHCGIDHFSVFSIDEAERVLSVKQPETAVMIMGWIPPEGLIWVLENDMEFWVFEPERLKEALKLADKLGVKARIHIELETGMNRTGFGPYELNEIWPLLRTYKDAYVLEGLCTHLAGAESIANHVRIQRQIKRFRLMTGLFKDRGYQAKSLHAASSAATIVYPAFQFDMVRVGILQYGYWPSKETFIHYVSRRKKKIDPLDRIISWKSSVMAVKHVRQGEFVSYGTTYLATEDKTIAIVPTGYSHGYSRALSNSGRILIHGQRVAVIGMINMNMLIADVSSLRDVVVGDEVVLIGKQEHQTISVASFSELSNQLNYELLTRLPAGILRRLTP